MRTVCGIDCKHFILWGKLKRYVRTSYPVEWRDYTGSWFYKYFLFDRGIINDRFGYFMQFASAHESLLKDQKIIKRVREIQWVHGIAAILGIIAIITIISLYRPY